MANRSEAPAVTPVVQTALIGGLTRPRDVIFGRPLLERLMLVCERSGVSRFFVETPAADDDLRTALGSFRDSPAVSLVASRSQALEALPPEAPCLALQGNLVLSASRLREAIQSQAARPDGVLVLDSADETRAGTVAVGPLHRLVTGDDSDAIRMAPAGPLP